MKLCQIFFRPRKPSYLVLIRSHTTTQAKKSMLCLAAKGRCDKHIKVSKRPKMG